MKHLKVSIWNDLKGIADDWAGVVSADGFDVSHSWEHDPVVFAQFVARTRPDIVLLDILNEATSEAQGLGMAAKIRETDLLVPLVAVTREPARIYSATDKIESIGFAGIYHNSIMSKGLVKQLAVRHSLNNWHGLLPDYVLIRAGIGALRRAFPQEPTGVVSCLISALERLAFSASTESWHLQICETLHELLGLRDWQGLSDKFQRVVSLFQDADPYYMAATTARRHLSHNVQVFLLGLAILLENSMIKEAAISDLKRIRESLSHEVLLEDAILIWGCIATTHDVAYLSQHLAVVTEGLADLALRFSSVLSAGTLPRDPWNWPRTHHAEVGAKLWLESSGESGLEKSYSEIISRAIGRHDSKCPGVNTVDSAHWASFLAVLCDELQDWGRSRLEKGDVPWRLFTLEVFRIEENIGDKPASIELHFMAKDHARIMADFIDRSGPATTKRRFREILDTLRNNLRPSVDLEIKLAAHFVSRDLDDVFGRKTDEAVARQLLSSNSS